MPEHVVELLATVAAIGKLGARSITTDEVEQLPRNGRPLTIVIERTIEPTTWVVVTGWNASAVERRLLASR